MRIQHYRIHSIIEAAVRLYSLLCIAACQDATLTMSEPVVGLLLEKLQDLR